MSGQKFEYVLRGIIPSCEEELCVLRDILGWALKRQWGMVHAGAFQSEEIHHYFAGLVEALEIYHSIHGEHFSPESIALNDKSLYEIKQIRDLCLLQGGSLGVY